MTRNLKHCNFIFPFAISCQHFHSIYFKSHKTLLLLTLFCRSIGNQCSFLLFIYSFDCSLFLFAFLKFPFVVIFFLLEEFLIIQVCQKQILLFFFFFFKEHLCLSSVLKDIFAQCVNNSWKLFSSRTLRMSFCYVLARIISSATSWEILTLLLLPCSQLSSLSRVNSSLITRSLLNPDALLLLEYHSYKTLSGKEKSF